MKNSKKDPAVLKFRQLEHANQLSLNKNLLSKNICMNLHSNSVFIFFLNVAAHTTMVAITKHFKIFHNYDLIPYIGMSLFNPSL